MLPTSMPLRSVRAEPQVGQGSPSRTFVISATMSGREVAADVDVAQVPALPVRPGDEVRRAHDELVDDDDGVPSADRRAVAGLHAAGLDLIDRGRSQAADAP